MAFSIFKKKKEVVDFRENTSSDAPSEGYLKRKNLSSSISAPSPSSNSSSTMPSSFGGFFGSSDSSSSSNNNQTQEQKTDFWGNPIASSDNISESSSSQSDSRTEERLNDLIYKLSRISDRLELVEKKLDRLERRTGISSSSE